METRRAAKAKKKALGELAKIIANGEKTVLDIIRFGDEEDATTATEFFYVLRGIQLACKSFLPPPEDPLEVLR